MILATVTLLLASAGSAAREGPWPILDPKRYASPSGQFVLEVDPSERFGAGPGKYRLLKDNVEVWSGERPFTFWDAVVADDGAAAGYAYTMGWHDRGGAGEFTAFVLGPTGDLVRRESEARKPAHTDGPPSPLGSGVFADFDRHRAIVRATSSDDLSETWWIVPLSKEGQTRKVRPAQHVGDVGRRPFVVAARSVPSTPWTIVEWWKDLHGALFTLLDPDFQVAWRFELADEYASPSEGIEKMVLWNWIKTGAAVSTGPRAGEFGIHSVAGQELIRFEAVADSSAEHGCRVREVGREPREIRFEIPKEPEWKEIQLRSLGRVTLGSAPGGPTSPVHDVYAFDFDARGGIEVIRRSPEDESSFTWVRVDADGKLDREVALARLPYEGERRVAWLRLGDDRWLALASDYGIGGRARGWIVDTRSGEPRELAGFDCPFVEAVAAAPDHGFVALVTVRSEYQMGRALLAFDAEGRKRWRIDQPASNGRDPAALFSPSDVAVRVDGTVLVTDSTAKRLQLFDASGAFVRAVDLSEAWKAEAEYPCRVLAAKDGGVFVKDGGAKDLVYRMPAGLDAGTPIELRYPDGREPPPNGYKIRLAPDGKLWTTDDQELECFDETGLLARAVGPAPDASAVSSLDEVFVDATGRILALDSRSKVIQVFDSSGKPTTRIQMEPSDTTDFHGSAAFAASGSGDVFLPAWKLGGYVQFDRAGHRVGSTDFGSGQTSFRCAFPPGSDRPWIKYGYEPQILVPAGERPRPAIVRRPDGRWLRSGSDMTFGADGTFAILDESERSLGSLVPFAICTYAADGTPRDTIEVPKGAFGTTLAVLEKWFVLTGDESALLVERQGDRRLRFPLAPPKDKNVSRSGFRSPDGKELWIVDPETRTLERFAQP